MGHMENFFCMDKLFCCTIIYFGTYGCIFLYGPKYYELLEFTDVFWDILISIFLRTKKSGSWLKIVSYDPDSILFAVIYENKVDEEYW